MDCSVEEIFVTTIRYRFLSLFVSEVDEVVYKGIKFRRYPNSENYADRSYYRPSGNHISDGVEAFHRELWKDHIGEIPEGHHIHHKDGDTTNNSLDNLECLSPQEHAKKHPENCLSPEDIEKGIEAAKEWHKSEEGIEWHKEHFSESLGKAFVEKELECDYCKETFVDKTSHKNTRFCSNACKSAWRRDVGVDDVERKCVVCDETFMVNKYKDKETCGRSCGGKLAAMRRSS